MSSNVNPGKTSEVIAPVVVPAGPTHAASARLLSNRLGLIYRDQPLPDDRLLLEQGDRLTLHENRANAPLVCADFLGGPTGYRLRQGAGRREPLARALGLHKRPLDLVVDATAGLGRDTVWLAQLGCRVVACERSPIVAALLLDGLDRARSHEALAEALARIEVRQESAEQYLAVAGLPLQGSAVYLDPMYADHGSAAAKKEMSLFREMLGQPADGEGEQLLRAAIESGAGRVVVKRPLRGRDLGSRPPDWRITGSSTRYDVYSAG